MRVDFPKKSNVHVQKQKCGISNDVFFAEAELRKFKSQCIVLNWGTSSHRLFCVRKRNCWTSRHSIFLVRKRNFKSQDILCAEAELRDLKVKALVWKRNCENSSRTKFTVWKRNCVTSKSQYFPCAEAELLHFRAPSLTLFCMRKRNCGTLKSPQRRIQDMIEMTEFVLLSTASKTAWKNSNWFKSYDHFSQYAN